MSPALNELRQFCSGRSILLVGNGSCLRKTSAGSRIDAFDVVVRMNHGFPRKDLIDQVGRRTDIWVCAYNVIEVQPVEYAKFQPRFALRLNNDTHVHPDMRDRFLSWDFQENENVKAEVGINDKIPSTGVVCIYFFRRFLGLDLITIAGFDSFETNNFYEPTIRANRIAGRWHDPNAERSYIDRLVRLGEISRL